MVNADTPKPEEGACELRAQGEKKKLKGMAVSQWTHHRKHLGRLWFLQYRSSTCVQRKTKQRSVENPGQEKHGNISFLLTQEFGSHLREVALIFRPEPSAIRFTHVEYWKKITC